jgi:DNA repair protein RecO (recombination protein O)
MPVSEIIKDRAVVLKHYDYGESSIVAVALTRSHGKVRILAKGARRSKSALQGVLRTGNLCEVILYFRPERGLQVLKEIETVSTFETPRGDLERLCLFQAGLEIIDRSIVEREADETVFDAFETFMRLLPEAADPWPVFFALEIAVLKTIGSFPSTASCGRCRRHLDGEPLAIDPLSGLVTCLSCAGRGKRALSGGSSSAISGMERSGVAGAAGLSLARAERKEIGELIHRLFVHHVDGYRLPNALRLCKGVSDR